MARHDWEWALQPPDDEPLQAQVAHEQEQEHRRAREDAALAHARLSEIALRQILESLHYSKRH
jgi:hypothetical protein